MKRQTPSPASTRPFKKPRQAKWTRPPRVQSALASGRDELRYFDVNFSTDATTTPSVGALNNMAAGDTNITRDANKISMKAIMLRVGYSNEAIAQNVRTRWVLVLDHNSNGASAAMTDVFDAATIESQRKVANLSRFTVLMDKVVTLNSTTSTAGAFQKAFFKKYVKIPQDNINNIASYADGTAASPITNGLSLMYVSDVATGATDQDVIGTVRLFFLG